MSLKEKVFWHETTVMPTDENLHDLPAKADLVVVGGGIPGLSAARQLAITGRQCGLAGGRNDRWGASSRNGGMALTGLKLDAALVEARYGHDLTRQLFDDWIASLNTVGHIVSHEQIDCGFARAGHLLLANKPAHYEAMQKEAEWYRQHFNHVSRTIPRSELQEEIASDVYYGGLVDETSAGLNPAQYVAGLAKAAERAGATLHPHARVLQFNKVPGGYQLKTQRGEIGARQVLVTTGGYTKAATPSLQKRIIPIGSYVIATEPIPENMARKLIPHNRMVFDYKHFLNYYRFSADHRMVFGGRATFFPETPSSIRDNARHLQHEMVHIFPQLKDVKVEYAWAARLTSPLTKCPTPASWTEFFTPWGLRVTAWHLAPIWV